MNVDRIPALFFRPHVRSSFAQEHNAQKPKSEVFALSCLTRRVIGNDAKTDGLS
jgi:hypothetical protein